MKTPQLTKSDPYPVEVQVRNLNLYKMPYTRHPRKTSKTNPIEYFDPSDSSKLKPETTSPRRGGRGRVLEHQGIGIPD